MHTYKQLRQTTFYHEEVISFYPEVEDHLEILRYFRHFSHDQIKLVLACCWSAFLFRRYYPDVIIEAPTMPTFVRLEASRHPHLLNASYFQNKIDILGKYPDLDKNLRYPKHYPILDRIEFPPEIICEIKRNTSERGIHRAFHQALFYAYKNQPDAAQFLLIGDWDSSNIQYKVINHPTDLRSNKYPAEYYLVDEEGENIQSRSMKALYVSYSWLETQIVELLFRALRARQKYPHVPLAKIMNRMGGILDFMYHKVPLYGISKKYHKPFDTLSKGYYALAHFVDKSEAMRSDMMWWEYNELQKKKNEKRKKVD